MEMWTSGRITFHFLPQAVLMWHFRCVMLWLSIGGIALAPPELAASREQPTPGPLRHRNNSAPELPVASPLVVLPLVAAMTRMTSRNLRVPRPNGPNPGPCLCHGQQY